MAKKLELGRNGGVGDVYGEKDRLMGARVFNAGECKYPVGAKAYLPCAFCASAVSEQHM